MRYNLISNSTALISHAFNFVNLRTVKRKEHNFRKLLAPRHHIWADLKDSEQFLINYKNKNIPLKDLFEDVDHGLSLYILNHEIPVITTWFLRLFGLPKSLITKADLELWKIDAEVDKILSGIGMFIAFGKYELFDLGWFEVIKNYVLVHIGLKRLHCFNLSPIPKDFSNKVDEFTVNVVGDFGTGIWKDGIQAECPAQLVQKAMNENQADIHLHLGDIYYSGTRREARNGFLKTWSPGKLGSYNMNGNHDLYSGDGGYYHTVLKHSEFVMQNKTSYFSFRFNNWLFIGLDSSYYSDAFFCTEGRLTDQNQIDFIKKQTDEHKGRIALFTHHGPISSDGSAEQKLWNDVTSVMKVLPDVWYFGHIHNCMFYNETVLGNVKTKFRCAGHGSLPFGLGYKLEAAREKKIIDWYPDKPLKNPGRFQTQRVMNGYVNLKIKGDKLIETAYNQDGTVAHQVTI